MLKIKYHRFFILYIHWELGDFHVLCPFRDSYAYSFLSDMFMDMSVFLLSEAVASINILLSFLRHLCWWLQFQGVPSHQVEKELRNDDSLKFLSSWIYQS